MARTAESKPLGEGASRTVVSLPKEIVEKIDARIKQDGGDALKALGVGPETLRTGFVHKLLNEALPGEHSA